MLTVERLQLNTTQGCWSIPMVEWREKVEPDDPELVSRDWRQWLSI